MKAHIAVEGIECYSYHGCLQEESVIGGRYVVDVYFETDIAGALEEDDLSQTIDYVKVNEIVQREMQQRSKLIEHAAGRILKTLRSEFKECMEIKVRLTKHNPPAGYYVEKASVTVVDNLSLPK
jgi:dihydroneopterin aldolase